MSTATSCRYGIPTKLLRTPLEVVDALERLHRLVEAYFGPWAMGSLEQRARDFRTQASVLEVSDAEFGALRARLAPRPSYL